jgi:ATP-dependent DNA ligase
MPLAVAPGPFDSPDWIFEVKYDGFRALAYASGGTVHLVSRKANVYKSFGSLCSHLASVLPAETVLDGEIVCLDGTGRGAGLKRIFSPSIACCIKAETCGSYR